jgi:hypothetical protein
MAPKVLRLKQGILDFGDIFNIIAKLARKWLEPVGVRTLFIESGSPRERKQNDAVKKAKK